MSGKMKMGLPVKQMDFRKKENSQRGGLARSLEYKAQIANRDSGKVCGLAQKTN